MDSNPIAISVVIASYNARSHIGGCLDSLAVQARRSDVEVIVVDSSADGTADWVAGRYPWVRLLRFNTRKFAGDARNLGIRAASGRVVAFLDADCRAGRDWIEALRLAHCGRQPAIGGSIANGSTQSRTGWAAYFCEFSQWMPRTPASWTTDVAGANMSYKRGVFETFGALITGTYCSDTEFHWRLAAAGVCIRFEPAIRVFHHGIDRWQHFLRHEVFHGFCFALVRSASRRFSAFRAGFYSAGLPLIALRLTGRVARCHLKNPVYRRPFAAALPLTALGVAAWSLGESFGYAFSLVSALRRRT